MSKPTLIIIGAGGHAEACIDVIDLHDQFQIAGIVGAPAEVGTERLGYRVIASDEGLAHLAKDHRYALVAVGQIKSADHRVRLFALAQELGFSFPVITSPIAYVSRHAFVDAGTIVMHGAIINAGARIGKNCIVNSRALVEHGTIISDHCHISTGAILNGDVRVGAGSFVGSNSAIKEGVVLGRRCLVGMSACVRRNQADDARVTG